MAAKKPTAKAAEKAEPKREEPKADTPEDNSIDARMARLLEDHRRMGARP